MSGKSKPLAVLRLRSPVTVLPAPPIKIKQHGKLLLSSSAIVTEWTKPSNDYGSKHHRRRLHTAAIPTPPHIFDPSFPPNPTFTSDYGRTKHRPWSDGSDSTETQADAALSPYSDLTLPNPSSFLSDVPLAAYYQNIQTPLLNSTTLPRQSLVPFYRIPPLPERPFSRKQFKRGNQTFSQTSHVPSLCLTNGASGIPKRSKALVESGELNAAASSNSKSTTRQTLQSSQVGEDAYFVRSDSLGVADGVGGWSGRKDADPALFSRLLMHYCAVELSRYDDIDDPAFLEYDKVDPIDIMQSAADHCLASAKEQQLVGSSTALIAVLRRDILRVANLGDCNCSIIRGTEYLFRSDEQQHAFNYPLQIGTSSKDMPKKDAQRFDVKVRKDDIVILSSDGLIDNLFEEDILEEVLRFSYPMLDIAAIIETGEVPASLPKQAVFSPQDVSDALCRRAKAVCHDQLAVASPFQQKAMEEGIYYTGGKPDDITVCVAVVGDKEDSPDRR